MIVTLIGIASVMLVRIENRSVRMTGDLGEARLYARSGIDFGLFLIDNNPDWRAILPNGSWTADQAIGSGTFSLEVIDPNDGDLGDSDYNPVVLTGTGVMGEARHKMQVVLVADIKPLEALNTCLHAADVFVQPGKSIAVYGAPLSTNGQVDNDGTIDGDVEAGSIASQGTITGTLTTPADAKQMPDSAVFDMYRDLATTIPFTGNIEGQVIAPAYNPWGAINSDGVYFIDTGGNDLRIKGCRIYGTLVVRATGHKVILDDAVFLHNYRSDYPVLIVDGNVEIRLKSNSYGLTEGNWATNFNPPGAPYEGVSDEDQTDDYPNEIHGLVHVKGTLLLKRSARVRGTIICESTVTCDDFSYIIHDPKLYTSPPQGYTFVDGMKVSPGSWKQTVD